ncbi:hypothetical protein [Legionella norrlandica]|uniref:hypothetical protein n=1 Tax=Legionella norrlandica TaxID=1498499 RepID=UPI001F4CCD8A|nr:hypothetical protein [Legionella norrlandica]
MDESSTCHISSPRQQRRLDAEQQWITYSKQHHMELSLLRIAGIYGPNKIPIEAAQLKTPVIDPREAPYTNHIYVIDLVFIAYLLSQIHTKLSVYNVADGIPMLMGELQQTVAKIIKIAPAPYESYAQAWERSSSIKREFIQASKRLNIDRLKNRLGKKIEFTPLFDAIKQCL